SFKLSTSISLKALLIFHAPPTPLIVYLDGNASAMDTLVWFVSHGDSDCTHTHTHTKTHTHTHTHTYTHTHPHTHAHTHTHTHTHPHTHTHTHTHTPNL